VAITNRSAAQTENTTEYSIQTRGGRQLGATSLRSANEREKRRCRRTCHAACSRFLLGKKPSHQKACRTDSSLVDLSLNQAALLSAFAVTKIRSFKLDGSGSPGVSAKSTRCTSIAAASGRAQCSNEPCLSDWNSSRNPVVPNNMGADERTDASDFGCIHSAIVDLWLRSVPRSLT